MLQMLSLPKVGKVIGGIERFILQSSSINDIVLTAHLMRRALHNGRRLATPP